MCLILDQVCFFFPTSAGNHFSGIPTSVLEVVYQVENVSGKKVPLRFGNRRVGDIPVSYCRTEKAQRELGWGAKRKLKEICEDQWNFLNSRF